MKSEKEVVDVELVEGGARVEGLPCTVCGEPLNGLKVIAQAELPDLVIRVCEYCLGSGDVDENLADQAEALRERAAGIEALIGRLRLPSFTDWKAREDFADFTEAPINSSLN